MLPQEAKPIVNSILPFKPIIDHDTAVSMHHIAAGGSIIGKRVHFLHHTIIIIGKRDGIIKLPCPLGLINTSSCDCPGSTAFIMKSSLFLIGSAGLPSSPRFPVTPSGVIYLPSRERK